jgi:translation initiation factor 2B subunit (eIF-2B alpha/beta/delta family)
VVSVTHTTKKDAEYEDKGSLLTAALKDLDFNRQLSKMYEGYAKKLYESRNTLERFILRKHDNELSEETYKAFIINLLEERKQRHGDTFDEEFRRIYDDLERYHDMRKHAEEFGKEVTSWFEDMTRQISEKTAENFKFDMEIRGKRRVIKQQQDEIERLKQRTLWERITRKGE